MTFLASSRSSKMLFKSAKKGAEKTGVKYVPHSSLIGDDVTEGKCTDEDGDEPILLTRLL